MKPPSQFLFFLAPLLVILIGCETTRVPNPTSTASRQEVVTAAVALERAGGGREASIGGGPSMAPIYGENSVIVTQPIKYEDLEKGMIVAFINAQGIRVVHQLTRLTQNGWRSQGLNNAFEDEGYVTPQNLIGVVYGVFQSEGKEST